MVSMDIVGHVRLADTRRLDYLLATLRSLHALAPLTGRVRLNVENGRGLRRPLARLLRRTGFRDVAVSSDADLDFGPAYRRLLAQTDAPAILHLEEDHLCMLTATPPMAALLAAALARAADLVPLTFHRLQQERLAILPAEDVPGVGRLVTWDATALARVRAAAPPGRPGAFFVGNNAVFARPFAERYWGRPIAGTRPHVFELVDPPDGVSLRLLQPAFEVLRPIDDDHGVAGSCCLASNDARWVALAGTRRPGVGWLRRRIWTRGQRGG
jgi:hypothetical protein